jgi:hypothetical protein
LADTEAALERRTLVYKWRDQIDAVESKDAPSSIPANENSSQKSDN